MLAKDLINRAAPPGTSRYFSLLYTPIEKRQVVTALFIIDTEIRATATQVSHDVAHTRLQWWRAEIDRLINRNAQHPATKTLQAAVPNLSFANLHELMVAADMDLSRMTYNTAREFDVYLDRSGGVLAELIAQCLLTDAISTPTREVARILGRHVRRTEALRDLMFEARAGRIYWPMDELQSAHVDIADLHAKDLTTKLRELIAAETLKLHQGLTNPLQKLPQSERMALRPLNVLAQLHAQLLNGIAEANHEIAQHRDVGPLQKVWTAWRAARAK